MFDVFPGLSLESVKHKVVKLIHQLDIDTNCLTYYNLSILLLHAKMYHIASCCATVIFYLSAEHAYKCFRTFTRVVLFFVSVVQKPFMI